MLWADTIYFANEWRKSHTFFSKTVLLFQVVEVFLCGVVRFFALDLGLILCCDWPHNLIFPIINSNQTALKWLSSGEQNFWEELLGKKNKIIKGYRTYTISTYKPILTFLIPHMRLISLTFKCIICVWSVYICVCSNIYGHTCVGTYASMSLCLWNPRINLRGCPSADIHLLLKQGLSLRTWRSLIKLGWLASSLGGSTCLRPSTEVLSLCHQTFYVGDREKCQVLI